MNSLRTYLPSGSRRVVDNLNTQTFRYLTTRAILLWRNMTLPPETSPM